MSTLSTRRIFITGGASGLGQALAYRYARDGWSVCIADIHIERAEETLAQLTYMKAEQARMQFIHCDVTVEDDFKKAAAWLSQYWGGVDIVINNAGVASAGPQAEIPISDWQWILNINLLGVVRGCATFTPIFKKQRGGQFINISSAAGLIHTPKMSAYNASKSAVVALSETLRHELWNDKIKVSVVCPSFFRTNLLDTMRSMDRSSLVTAHNLVSGSVNDAHVIAEKIFDAAKKNRFLILPDSMSKFAFYLKRLIPFSVYAFIIRFRTNQMMKHELE